MAEFRESAIPLAEIKQNKAIDGENCGRILVSLMYNDPHQAFLWDARWDKHARDGVTGMIGGGYMSEVRAEELVALEAQITQFNRLIQDLLKGSLNRNTFHPWEIDVLLDIEGCQLSSSNRREVLRRYQRAVQRNYERGSTSLLLLSDYLDQARSKRRGRGADGE
jgi:hypothetical protein